MLAEGFQMTGQIGRERRLHLDAFARERVREAEPRRVEELAAEPGVRSAVDGVADDRKPDRREMHADLVRASGFEPDAQERVVADQLNELEVGDRSSRAVCFQGLAGRVAPVSADRRLDPPRPRPRPAADERQIFALQLVLLDKALQSRVRLRGARDDEQAGGVSIEAVNDAGPLLLPTRGAVLEDAVDERSGAVTGRRVDDDSRRLVDDEQVLVLVGDPEADVLRLERA